MEKASAELDFETRRALSRPPRGAVGDPVAAGHQSAHASRKPTCSPSIRRAAIPASRCSSSAPGRTGATAPISRAPTVVHAGGGAGRVPRAVLRRQAAAELILLRTRSRNASCWPRRCAIKAGLKVEVSTPQRGEKKELVAHALTNAREALGRKLADTASQSRLLQGMADDARTAAARRSASRSTTTATSRAPTRSAR